jgi:hypothetical protein
MPTFCSGSPWWHVSKLVAVVGLIAVVAACDDDDDEVVGLGLRTGPHAIAAEPAGDPPRTTLEQDDTVRIRTVITDVETGDTLSFAASFRALDTTVSVSSTGLLRARSGGTGRVEVRATINDSTIFDTTTVTVTADPATLLTLEPDTTIERGDAFQLRLVIRNAAGELLLDRDSLHGFALADRRQNRITRFVSADTMIATVDAGGVVRGVRPGTTTIRATELGGLTDVVTITVVRRAVRTVIVTPNPAEVRVGRTLEMTAQLVGRNSEVLTGRTITWSSSNPLFASVDPNTGVVTGHIATPAGQPVVITATSEGVSGSAVLTVTP